MATNTVTRRGFVKSVGMTPLLIGGSADGRCAHRRGGRQTMPPPILTSIPNWRRR